MVWEPICSAATMDWNPFATLVGAAGGAAIGVYLTLWATDRKDRRVRDADLAELAGAFDRIERTMHDLGPNFRPNENDDMRLKNLGRRLARCVHEEWTIVEEAIDSGRSFTLAERAALRRLKRGFESSQPLTSSTLLDAPLSYEQVLDIWGLGQELLRAVEDFRHGPNARQFSRPGRRVRSFLGHGFLGRGFLSKGGRQAPKE